MSKKTDYKGLYQNTDLITPLEYDCGKLCGSICCQSDQKGHTGVYLLPGEEEMFTGNEDWLRWEMQRPEDGDFPPDWEYPVYFIQCIKPCPRDRRPLSCRFFPLAPHLLRDNTLLLIHETLTLPYLCPLIEKKVPLRRDFIETVALCWQELLKDRRIYSLVKMDSQDRESEGIKPTVLWWGKRLLNQHAKETDSVE